MHHVPLCVTPCACEFGIKSNYLTAKEPEHRVAHIPPIVAPGPVDQGLLNKPMCTNVKQVNLCKGGNWQTGRVE